MVVLGRLCGDALFLFASRRRILHRQNSRAIHDRPYEVKRMHEHLCRGVCDTGSRNPDTPGGVSLQRVDRIPYAEREPATGRAVSACLTACNIHQARACQRRPAPKINAGPAPRPDHTCFTRLPSTSTLRQFARRGSRQKNAGPPPQPDHTCFTRLPTTSILRQFVTGHCPKNKKTPDQLRGPTTRVSLDCQLPPSSDSLSAATRRRK